MGRFADRLFSQGYDADHRDIDLLRLKNYTVGCKLTDEEVTGKGGLERISTLLTCMKPFVGLLSSLSQWCPTDFERSVVLSKAKRCFENSARTTYRHGRLLIELCRLAAAIIPVLHKLSWRISPLLEWLSIMQMETR